MRLPWVSRAELDRSQFEIEDLRGDALAATKLAERLADDLATERDRYERLVEKMADLQRAGFTAREPVRYQPSTPDLPEPVLAAILARSPGVGSEIGRQLVSYAVTALADGQTPEQVETAIWNGEGG